MINLTDKTVIISGGSPALAAGIERVFRQAGATPHILDEAMYDALDPVSVKTYLSYYEKIDTAIILPEFYGTEDFTATSQETWESALQNNYERAVYLSQAAAQHMIKGQTRGSITFLSTVAIHMPLMETSVYATSLAMLYPLAKMAAVDCGSYGIRVNTVTMGWVENEWTAPQLQDKQAVEHIKSGIPLGEISPPEAIGDVCCFLASPLARHITGAIIPVDGGYTLTRSAGNTPYPAE